MPCFALINIGYFIIEIIRGMPGCPHTNSAALTRGKDVVCCEPDVCFAAKPEAHGIFTVSVVAPLREKVVRCNICTFVSSTS
jgi:hypothetical protein